jgi:hypothetical protein
MESRVTDGYVVLPTGNRTGSVKVYDIVTGKIITRDQFKKCPMPDSVIQHLNKQALAEGRNIDTAHMHVFDELLNSCKLSPSHAPTYFTPTLMQDDRPQFATPPNLPRYPTRTSRTVRAPDQPDGRPCTGVLRALVSGTRIFAQPC